MNSYKKLLFKFMGIMLILGMFVVSALYIYDPLQIYHKPWISNTTHFSKKMRLQDAGIINNYDFDAVILGTSMLASTSAQNASQKMKSNFVNLSIPGGDLYERSIILNQVLRKKKLKQVIYSLDTGWDLNLQRHNKRYPKKNFDFLYDNNPFNDLKVYWNDKYIKCLLIFSLSEECVGKERDILQDDSWFIGAGRMHDNRAGVSQWIKMGKSKNTYNHIMRRLNNPLTGEKKYKKKLSTTYKIINKNLLTYVKRNRQTQFHIVFPPYSRFLFAVWRQKDYQKYKLYIETLKYLVENSLKYKNLKVYAFDSLSYLDDLNNYVDTRHYGPEMNNLFLDAIKEKNFFKSKNELEVFIKKIDILNNKYDIDPIINRLNKAHKKRVILREKNITSNNIEIEGSILANKVTHVELWQNRTKLERQRLYKNRDIYKKYPQYKLLRNSFKLYHTIESNKKIKLVFKYKNKVIKKVYLTDKEGNNIEK